MPSRIQNDRRTFRLLHVILELKDFVILEPVIFKYKKIISSVIDESWSIEQAKIRYQIKFFVTYSKIIFRFKKLDQPKNIRQDF